MLARFWNYLTSQFRKEPQNVVNTVPHSVHSKPKIQTHPPRSILALQNAQLHAAHQQINVEFKLVLDKSFLPPVSQQEAEKQEMHADVIEQIQQLTQDMEKLRVSEEKIAQKYDQYPNQLPHETIRGQKRDVGIRRQFELKKQYQAEVEEYLDTKYSKEKSDYAFISQQSFKKIKEYWKNKSKGHYQIKTTGFDCVQKLTYKALGGLHFGQWLNDDVINIYIQMMEKTFIRDQNTPYRILNSYFATTTLQKSQAQIQRLLRKKNLEKNHMLIMPINNKNHWYFAIFQYDSIVVYDSIRHQEQYYYDNQIFKNAMKFAKMFYDKDVTLSVRKDYPQQDNSYDCGVFMLNGIRDTLRKKQWSYHQGDIRYKRIQISYEILEQKLIYVD